MASFRGNLAKAFSVVGVLCASLLVASCNSTKVDVYKERAAYLMTQPMLLIAPISPLPDSKPTCQSLGLHFSVEVPKRVSGGVVYSENVDGLKNLATWANLTENGAFNTSEAAAMAKSVGCLSAVAVQVLEFKQYPPFKMVVVMCWIDASTGNIIGKVYNDVDVSDTQVNYRYRCFSGQGPMKELYEEFNFSEDLFQTANLMPEKFKLFVASFTSNVMFKTAEDKSWYLWRVF